MRVCIILGSQSDEAVVRESGMTGVLRACGVKYSAAVYSAHRNHDALTDFCREQVAAGAQVFIAIAGMAAALPGAVAAITNQHLPVIAVPLDEHGIDSCLYMPPGVPVLLAGVGKPGLKNAAIAACQILALNGAGSSPVRGEFSVWLMENTKPPLDVIEL